MTHLRGDGAARARVALKAIRPELAGDLGERFEREIRITAGLQHPNILPLLDSGVVDGIQFYIMPLVEGDSVKTRGSTHSVPIRASRSSGD